LKSKAAKFIEFLLQRYHLAKLPFEGGVFFQGYQSAEMIPLAHLPARYTEAHPYGTAIFYLFTDALEGFSAMHFLPTDEVYHFYLGDPVEMLLLYPDGSTKVVILGQDIVAGQEIQFVVPAGVWQGSHLQPGGEYALMGTTMAPGYIDSDLILGKREELTALYPAQKHLIRELTRE
jgi:uncharacterized protein